jgi:hypothetical protein
MTALLLMVGASFLTPAAQSTLESEKVGATVDVGGRKVTIRRMEVLPLVENEYSKVFKFDAADNPKLKDLREKNGLDQVVAAGKDEFDRQVLLLDWVNRRFKKFGRPSASPKGAIEILKSIDEGHTFFCAHYGTVLVSAAASLGWVDRSLALRRPDSRGSGSTEHTITEIWSNQYRKWVMFDPTFGMYVEKDGLPLTAFEIRDEWFTREGKALTFVLNAERKRYTVKDLPVFRARYAGFGDLKLGADCFDTYAFLGYVPNTDLMDSGCDYGRMFITQDQICDGTSWHKRKNPKDPAREPYFPIQQAALTLTPAKDSIQVALKTLTPNFKTFRVRVDGKEATDAGASLTWSLHPGLNRLEALSVNAFGVEGAPSVVELEVAR